MHRILKSAALAGLFSLPLAPILSFSTDAQAEDCPAPPPDAVLCEDFAGLPAFNPLDNFVVTTPISGQAAMNVGIDSEELFFRHIGGFSTAIALRDSPLGVINKRLEGDVRFDGAQRSNGGINWSEGGTFPQNRIAYTIQIDENRVIIDSTVAPRESASFSPKVFASNTTYRLSLVTLGPNRIQAFVDGDMLLDFPFDTSSLPASLLPGFSGNSRGVELRFDNLLVSCLICPVDIDIKPGSFPNSINLSSWGVTPVAILGSYSLDVNDIDTDTLTLGTAGVKTVGKKDRQLCSIEDVSGDFDDGLEGMPDGHDDLVCHFITYSIVAEDGDTTATLSGNFTAAAGGGAIEGSDSVNIVP